jgi:cytochrome c oxidase subunit II
MFGVLLVGISLLVAGCNRPDVPNMLDVQGPGAAQIARLWWLMFWLGLAVLLLVLALVTYAVFRDRPRQSSAQSDERHGERLIVYGGVVLPVPILAIVLGYTLFSGNVVTQPGSARLQEPASYLTIEVIGHQFWWEVHYPEQGVLTANEIHIPTGEPVFIRLTSRDVIHSFWVPQLHGKLDMVPGETNTMWIEADDVGVYRGICAEFCGIQHAHMHFLVVAQPADEFAAWLAHQQQPAAEPADPLIRQGQQVFMGAACVYCHTVNGLNEVPPTGTLGPDLTHVASRQTLAAGILENNRNNLGSWIVDPQSIKAGNRMPPTRLNSEDFQALLAYLESLR